MLSDQRHDRPWVHRFLARSTQNQKGRSVAGTHLGQKPDGSILNGRMYYGSALENRYREWLVRLSGCMTRGRDGE